MLKLEQVWALPFVDPHEPDVGEAGLNQHPFERGTVEELLDPASTKQPGREGRVVWRSTCQKPARARHRLRCRRNIALRKVCGDNCADVSLTEPNEAPRQQDPAAVCKGVNRLLDGEVLQHPLAEDEGRRTLLEWQWQPSQIPADEIAGVAANRGGNKTLGDGQRSQPVDSGPRSTVKVSPTRFPAPTTADVDLQRHIWVCHRRLPSCCHSRESSHGQVRILV